MSVTSLITVFRLSALASSPSETADAASDPLDGFLGRPTSSSRSNSKVPCPELPRSARGPWSQSTLATRRAGTSTAISPPVRQGGSSAEFLRVRRLRRFGLGPNPFPWA